MREWIQVVCVAATAAGCGSSKLLLTPPPPIPDERCINPAKCAVGNGTGVYFAEDGKAGMGDTQLMITHFNNRTDNGKAKVTFDGRYFEVSSGNWRVLDEPGTVTSATFNQLPYSVVSVGELPPFPPNDRVPPAPFWMLSNGTSATTRVIGSELGQLKLSIAFQIPGHGTQQFDLDFEPFDRDDPHSVRPTNKYIMHTHSLNGTTRDDYCFDNHLAPDPVVFQQGIVVDPVDGKVTADSTAVTMSCDLGAPATVYRWGYEYATTDLFYFASGIQMKRDSYCADSNYYTKSGTNIAISDDRAPDGTFPIGQLEASWTPNGAACADPQNARHPEIVLAKHFNWQCARTPPLMLPCPGIPSSGPYLIDALVPQPQP